MEQVALFMTVRTQPGKRDALLALWEKHLKARAQKNDVQSHYVIARDLEDEDAIRFLEVYEDRVQLEANAAAPWFADYMVEAAPLLAGEPDVARAAPHWIKGD